MSNKKLTYISLFSSAGIGCYGFKEEDFECIVTNELIPRRIEIQKFNKKCKYDSGYVCGDISDEKIKDLIDIEVNRWQSIENIVDIDVIIATPPCQGMSVANNKKNNSDLFRNSLVVESIIIIKKYMPKFFVFENVPSFMKTTCTDTDGRNKPISQAISDNLGSSYSFASKIINFKDYGASSSRSRTLVIGVRRDHADYISPYELFPDKQHEQTLRQVIGHLTPLTELGEIDNNDIYHSFRSYPIHMRQWISNLKEGQSAFENKEPLHRPHQVINGEFIPNQQKNGDKYRRQFWDKVGPCVHTRNDQLASQNTIHPADDRVFSIRELMLMMTVPISFRWSIHDLEYLNNQPSSDKSAYIKKEEIKIRQCLGEAVPTAIFQSIAQNIKYLLNQNHLTSRQLHSIINTDDFKNLESELSFLHFNRLNLSITTLMRISELTNTRKSETAAYYTNKSIITEILNRLPDTHSNSIRILEPSVGVGNFIPLILKRFDTKKITIDIVDIDEISLKKLSIILAKINIPSNVQINQIHGDFLLTQLNKGYDYIIGNPPFGRLSSKNNNLKKYQLAAINKSSINIFSFFLDKCLQLGNIVSLVLPKAILNTPEFYTTREYLSRTNVKSITDFGENGFEGVLVETIGLTIQTHKKPSVTEIYSVTRNINIIQTQEYITDSSLPYWIIYRNNFFDRISSKLIFDCFEVFRDRQITNSMLNPNNKIRVIKSRNISDDGSQITDIPGYDAYISENLAKKLTVFKYLNAENVYLTPNMTYKPRVILKPKGCLVNGSVAILVPKHDIIISQHQLHYFASDEYRLFYQIARNYQTRSLNVDASSVYFFGLLKVQEQEYENGLDK